MMEILFLCAVVNVVAIFQVRNLSKAMRGGSDWIANRLGLAAQGSSSPGHGGGGGSRALGMGVVGAAHSMPAHVLAGFAAASTVNSSPIAEWLFGGRGRPLSSDAKRRRRVEKKQLSGWDEIAAEWANSYQNIRQFNNAGLHAFRNPDHFAANIGRIVGHRNVRSVIGRGGVNTAREAAAIIEAVIEDGGGSIERVRGAMIAAGFTDERIMYEAAAARNHVDKSAKREPWQNDDLSMHMAALRNFQDDRTEFNLAEVETSALRLRNRYRGGVNFDDPEHERLARHYFENPTPGSWQQLRDIADGRDSSDNSVPANARVPIDLGTGPVTVNRDEAQRITTWVGNQHARQIVESLDKVMDLPEGELHSQRADRLIADLRWHSVRASNDDVRAAGLHRNPWSSPPPRPSSRTP
ncbi:hypothetical protein ACQP2U_33100 [Nocardia sp. CA-084685]|uniref:hypothetical protein n=1 Tax=Nocardia sp. CA-084685 TaxID=3239970 RepID=UPI003D99F206